MDDVRSRGEAVEAVRSRGRRVDARRSRGGHVDARRSRGGHVDGPWSRRGHMDLSIVPWIVLILAAIAAASLWERKTGRSWTVLWTDLPADWQRFGILTVVLAGVGVALVAGVASRPAREAARVERGVGRTVVHLVDPSYRALGLATGLFAVHFVVHAWLGDGLLWWGVGGVGAILGLVALAVLASGERVSIEPGRIAVESTFFGRPTPRAERRWDPPAAPSVTVATHATGGAFGQPYVERHALEVDGEPLWTGPRERVEALREAVAGALAPEAPRAEA